MFLFFSKLSNRRFKFLQPPISSRSQFCLKSISSLAGTYCKTKHHYSMHFELQWRSFKSFCIEKVDTKSDCKRTIMKLNTNSLVSKISTVLYMDIHIYHLHIHSFYILMLYIKQLQFVKKDISPKIATWPLRCVNIKRSAMAENMTTKRIITTNEIVFHSFALIVPVSSWTSVLDVPFIKQNIKYTVAAIHKVV